MGKHSARRRRGPVAVATGAAAVLAAGVFATTLADGSHDVPLVAAAPATTPSTTVQPATSRTSDRGEDLNRASRSFRRTPPPEAVTDVPAAPDDDTPSSGPSPAPTPSASPAASASRGPARTGTPSPTASPSTAPTTPSPSPSPSPSATATSSATPSPSGSVLGLLPEVIGGLVR